MNIAHSQSKLDLLIGENEKKNWRKESQRKPRKRMTMEGTHNSNFAPHRQDPRGNPMNKGITNEIIKLCANSGGVWA